MDNEYLTTSEAAALSQTTSNVITRAIRRGTLPATRRGHQWFILRDDLNEYIANKPRGGKPYHHKQAGDG